MLSDRQEYNQNSYLGKEKIIGSGEGHCFGKRRQLAWVHVLVCYMSVARPEIMRWPLSAGKPWSPNVTLWPEEPEEKQVINPIFNPWDELGPLPAPSPRSWGPWALPAAGHFEESRGQQDPRQEFRMGSPRIQGGLEERLHRCGLYAGGIKELPGRRHIPRQRESHFIV